MQYDSMQYNEGSKRGNSEKAAEKYFNGLWRDFQGRILEIHVVPDEEQVLRYHDYNGTICSFVKVTVVDDRGFSDKYISNGWGRNYALSAIMPVPGKSATLTEFFKAGEGFGFAMYAPL